MIEGFAITLVAGVVMGTNLVPLKWAKVWRWENFWLLYSVVSLVIAPLCLAFLVVPHFAMVYASLPLRTVAMPFAFGAAWGIAQLGAGVCVHRIGLALTGSILNGICAASGTLVPLSLQHREKLGQSSGMLILGGTGVMLVGVALCGWAGYRREEALRRQGAAAGFSPDEAAMSQAEMTRAGYVGSLVLAAVSGVLAALLNIALAFGGDIVRNAQAEGARPVWAPFAVWPIALLGGLLVNAGYSFYLLARNKTWRNFRGGSRELLNPVFAGCMWMGGIAIYSSGATFLGALGLSIGWALFQISLILCVNLAGVLTGEWRQMRGGVRAINTAGILILFVAVALLGAANYAAQ